MPLPIKYGDQPGTWTRDVVEAVAKFVESRSPLTRRAYGADLAVFARYVGAPSPGAALEGLLHGGPGAAFAVVTAYKTALCESGFAPATINRRLATLRSLTRFCRAVGLVGWGLEVPDVRVERRRDMRGPTRDVIQDAMNSCRRRGDAKGARDRALLRLMFDLALRCGEVAALDVGDVDLTVRTVQVVGKGRRERERRTLPEPTAAALAAWLAVRGDAPGPLFVNFDRAGKGDGRLTAWAIWHLCRQLGFRPHGLRHLGITTALDAGADLRAVQRYSRHADLKTVMAYGDNRADLAGDVARKVAATVV